MDAVRQKLAVVFFSVCWSSQVEAQGQGNTYAHFTIKMGSTEYLCLSAGVYLQLLGGARVPNHGFVGRGDLSGPTDNPLLCVTPDNITCCSTVETWRCSTRELVLPQWNRSPTYQYRMVVLHNQGTWCGTTAPSYWWCVRNPSLCDT